MVTIIAGSRTLGYLDLLEGIRMCPWEITKVISGGARGIDQAADLWALNNHLPRTTYLADWNEYGRMAGFIRNQKQADDPEVEACLLIWDGESKGTVDMLKRAEAKKLQTYLYMVPPKTIPIIFRPLPISSSTD